MRVPYDIRTDFSMLVLTNISPNMIAITPALPVNSVTELIAYAKRNPDQLLFGSAGNGGTMHLSMELFKLMTGTRMVHVPFKGMPQVITEIVGGRLQLMSDNVTSVLPHVTAGRLRALGVTGAKRIPLAPEIPTVAEAGVPVMRSRRGAATWGPQACLPPWLQNSMLKSTRCWPCR